MPFDLDTRYLGHLFPRTRDDDEQACQDTSIAVVLEDNTCLLISTPDI